jgi:hypothetical protein
MKKTLLALLVISSSVFAKEVVVDAHGDTYESALKNAKVAAIEQVNGTWINSEHKLKNNNYSENLAQYNGGVIKSYKVLSYDGRIIKIKADVDVIKNNIVGDIPTTHIPATKVHELESKRENYISKKNAVASLNDMSKAMKFTPSNVEYVNHGNITRVNVTGYITWIPKWKSDLTKLLEMSATPITQDTDTTERIKNGIVYSILMVNPVAGGLASIPFSKQDEKVREDTPVICVSDNCYKNQIGLTKFQYGSKIDVEVNGNNFDKSMFVRTIRFERTNLFENVSPGTTKTGMLKVKYTYNNPTLIIHDTTMPVSFYFDVQTEQLLKVDNLSYNLKGI